MRLGQLLVAATAEATPVFFNIEDEPLIMAVETLMTDGIPPEGRLKQRFAREANDLVVRKGKT